MCSLSGTSSLGGTSSNTVNFFDVVGFCVVTASAYTSDWSQAVAVQNITVRRRNNINPVVFPQSIVIGAEPVQLKSLSALHTALGLVVPDPNLSWVLKAGNGTWCTLTEQGEITAIALSPLNTPCVVRISSPGSAIYAPNFLDQSIHARYNNTGQCKRHNTQRGRLGRGPLAACCIVACS